MRALLVLGAALTASPALAEEPAGDEPVAEEEDGKVAVEGRVWGHVKTFAVGVVPYDHPLMPEEPVGQAFIDTRLNAELHVGEHVSAEVAHAVTTTIGSAALQAASTGVAPQAPQLVDLGWEALDADSSTFSLQGRTDRLNVTLRTTGVQLTLGRQPVSFGSGLFFTPLDLVGRFTPATIDTEYKPGVDAVRVDLFRGVSTQGTAIVTWADQPVGSDARTYEGLRAINAALYGQATVGVTDIGLFTASIQGDPVFGTMVATGVGPVALHGDATVTVPTGEDDADPYVRAVVGATGLPHWRLSLGGELYLQTLGTTDDAERLALQQTDRFQRGELWLTGLAYAGLTANLELTPLVSVGFASIMNLTDPSLFLAPSLSWSVSNNAQLAAGGYIGLGERPELLTLKSEFGTLPAVFFLQVRTYF